ncbi:EF-hand domain-containing protein [Pseudomonas sp. EA_5y_Pfl2_R50]|uniref:EF-hand domain-containing protein n=1 Tax=Pseudomonas sp. EA_5y_Pfl2_R50 TaxID=3088691 RepID=UPI0030DDABCF
MAITVEKLETLRNDFVRYDRNNDGKLTVREYELAMEPYTSPETLANAVKELDVDDNAEITWFEFLTDYVNDVVGRKAITWQVIEQFDKDFNRYDVNKDGKVSFNELSKSLDGYSTPIQLVNELNQLYECHDDDKDKQLTWDEFFISLVRSFE